MGDARKQMHLGVFVLGSGHHVGGWRLPDAEAGAENLDLLCRIARKAEAGKLDMVFFADALNSSPGMHPSVVVRYEPITLLSALAMVTERIGLAATANTTYSEPYNLARMFGTLDHISKGRAGWNVVTGAFGEAALNFSKPTHPPHAERYAVAEEYVDVVKGLWDSWEDDALVMDKDSGVFIDAAKMNQLNHEGVNFKVKGPLNLSRSPQGYPVLIQAGSSDAGRNLAARIGEVLFAVEQVKQSGIDFKADIRRRAIGFGRNPDEIKVMPGVCPIIADTKEAAMARLADLGAMMDPVPAMKVLSERLGTDLTDYPLDGPVPELPESTIMQGHARVLTALAKAENMTLRQLRDYTSAAMGHRLIVGTAKDVADGLEEWFVDGAADGFNIMPPYFPGGLDDFVDQVVPILQERGLFRTEYSGSTLRDHLGLARPACAAR